MLYNIKIFRHLYNNLLTEDYIVLECFCRWTSI